MSNLRNHWSHVIIIHHRIRILTNLQEIFIQNSVFRSNNKSVKIHNLKTIVVSITYIYSCSKKFSSILFPNPDSFIQMISRWSYLVLNRMATHWDHCVCVAFQSLQYIFLLKIPQIHTIVLWSTHNVLPIRYRKRRCDTEHFVGMSCVHFQKLPRRIVGQLLLNFWSKYKHESIH